MKNQQRINELQAKIAEVSSAMHKTYRLHGVTFPAPENHLRQLVEELDTLLVETFHDDRETRKNKRLGIK
jgi:hypothetical protein